jgi:hypothetical protein
MLEENVYVADVNVMEQGAKRMKLDADSVNKTLFYFQY